MGREPLPPHRPPLPRASGAWEDCLTRMLRQLAAWVPPPPSGNAASPFHRQRPAQAPLRGLVPRSIAQGPLAASDFTHGLLDAWATVAAVLSFYQERIREEGYLLTATEEFSVHELVGALGVVPGPALAARVDLCFTTSDKPGAPDTLELPRGLAVQSLPAPESLPQIFETSAPLLTCADWNAMPLWRPTPWIASSSPAPLRADAPGLLLKAGAQGVRTGDTLLLRGQKADGSEWMKFKTVRRAGRAMGRGCVAWDEPLDETLGTALLTGVEARVVRAPEPLFGHDAPAWKDLPLEKRLRYGTAVGGLLHLGPDPEATWKGRWVPTGKVLCLLASEEGLFAGVEGQGLLSSQDGGVTWKGVPGPLARLDVLCLGWDAQGQLVAGTRDKGVFRSVDQGHSWEALDSGTAGSSELPATPVRCVAGFLAGDDSNPTAWLLAGTDQGVFCWEESSGTWRPANKGLPLSKDGGPAPVSVRSLCVDEAGQRFILGTRQGVFFTRRIGERWEPRDPARQGQPVSAAAVDAHGALFVALEEGGLYRSMDDGKPYLPVGPKPATGVLGVRLLLTLSPGPGGPPGLLAATSEGLLRSRDGGTHWERLPDPDPLEVWALAEPAPGELLAVTPVVGVVEQQWPGWVLEAGLLELARLVPLITGDQSLVLEQEEPSSRGSAMRRAFLTVKEVRPAMVSGFAQHQLITRLRVEPAAAVTAFERARARVRSCGAPLLLLEQQIRAPGLFQPDADLDAMMAQGPLFDALVRESQPGRTPPREELVVDGAVALPEGRTVLVVGQPMRAWVGHSTAPLQLVADDGVTREPLHPGQILEVLEWPQGAPGSPWVWRLRTEHGFTGTARLTEGTLTLLPAAKDSDPVAVRRRVTGLVTQPGSTRLLLDAPLRELFDPDTVAVRGNVAEATHGLTVTEVLGSGDARRTHQRFRLKRPPLVWLAAPDGPVPALEVTVQGQRWHRVEDWRAQRPDSRVYVLRVDPDGTPWVCFGDGVCGARLPTGQENVQATYRTGGGPDGNVDAGRIAYPRRRPLGLRTVDNPLPASGGTAAELPSSLRAQAPRQVRTLGRIVSLRDFEDYVRAWPGVARVRARHLWNGHAPVLSLTVATTEEDTAHRMGEPLEEALRQELERFRPPTHVLWLGSYAPRPFLLEAALTVDPDFDAAEVKARVQQALTEGFRFEQRELAQPVATSDVLRLITRVSGVLNVRVTALRPVDAPASPVPAVLPAADNRWDPGTSRVLPAELLLLDRAGPTLTLAERP
jgi:photosystem II stability/assembly factor-like uncharacterized protein